MSSEKIIMPGSYVKLSYTIYDEEGKELYSTTFHFGEGEKKKEIEEPVIVKVGEREVFFEDVLLGKKEGQELEEVIPPEKAFGKRDPKKIISMPVKKLRAITGKKTFSVGDELYTEDKKFFGIIKYVGSREVLIDQNHPLAGKTLKLKAKILKVVNPEDSDMVKVNTILEKYFSNLSEKFVIELKDSELEITIKSDQMATLDDSTLLRYIYLPRKTVAKEILKETKIKKVVYRDEHGLEKEVAETPVQQVETKAIADAIGEISKVEESGEGESGKEETKEEKGAKTEKTEEKTE
ncbi:MAG: FKBP-type peptidyl-prolyl cis-trans isomerase [Candidatus Njordarchaeia archaeon]